MFGLLSSRQEIIERISFLSGCGHRFILLSGDKGVGKSTVIEYLLESYLEDFVRKYVSVSPNISDIQVRSLILEAVFPDAAFDPEISLVKSFAAHADSNEEKFLVIDNGQNISEQVSAELLQLSLDPERFHLSVLFASQNDSSNVKLLTEHSSVVSVNVDSLDLDESKQFLDYHFEELANDDLVTEFILKAGGHPQLLLKWEQRDTILDSTATDSEDTTDKPFNWRVPAIIVTALLGALAVQGYFYFQEQEDQSQLVVSQPKVQVVKQEPETTLEESEQTTEANDITTGDTSSDNELARNWNTEAAADNAIEPRPVENTEQIISAETTLDNSSDQLANADDNEAETQAAAESEVEVTEIEATVVTTEAEINESPINQESTSEPSNNANVSPLIAEGVNLKKAQWFNELPASSYFLQASGVSSSDTLLQFLRFEKILDRALVYETTRNNNPWFVVLFGPFDNADQARNAIAALPLSIQKLDPWAKSLTAIKRELPAAP